MIIKGNDNEFNNFIKDGIVLVDFNATWCGPCKMMSNVLEELDQDRSDIKIIKIDVDENQSLAKEYGIMSIPTLVLFKDGVQIDKKVGFMPKEEITSWIEKN